MQEMLEGKGAVELKVDNQGKKEIAYEVNGHRNGTFVTFTYGTENHDIVDYSTGLLRINEKVIKFQTHRINERMRKFQGNPKRAAEREARGDDGGMDADM